MPARPPTPTLAPTLSLTFSLVALAMLGGCQRNEPPPPPAVIVAPGPAGEPGPAGQTGATGQPGALVVVTPAASAASM